MTQKRGAFDNIPDNESKFWDVYASGALTKKQNRDMYYLRLDEKLALFNKRAGRQVRQTFGARWWGTSRRWDYDDEAVGQFGTFANSNIRARGIATDHGYTWQRRRQVRAGLRADAAIGDGGPQSRTIGTFSPLFSKGKYFGEADLNGPSNTMDILPNVALDLTHKLRGTIYYGAFWRQSMHDGLYGFGTNLERKGTNDEARFIGHQAEVDFDWPLNEHVLARVVYQHFLPGEFLKQSGPRRSMTYVAVWWVYRF